MMWHKVYRENGLVEIMCEHGVGHPSHLMTPPTRYYSTHGCCGCCSLAAFHLVEMKMSCTGKDQIDLPDVGLSSIPPRRSTLHTARRSANFADSRCRQKPAARTRAKVRGTRP